jgi:uncharacterized membrane protein
MVNRFGGRDDRGQALVELALVATILLTLLLATVEMGRIGHAYLTVLHASREGARLGALGREDKEITSRVQAAAGSIPAGQLPIEVSPAKWQRMTGESIEVSVSHSVHLVVPFISKILPNPFPVTGKTIMRIE